MNYVYYLLDPLTAQILYIGRSDAPRRRKYNFERRTGVETCMGIPQRYSDFEEACAAEIRAIGRHQPPFNKCLVSSPGPRGTKHSEEAKRKIGEANKGRTHTLEARAKMSAGQVHRKKMVRKERPAPKFKRRWQSKPADVI